MEDISRLQQAQLDGLRVGHSHRAAPGGLSDYERKIRSSKAIDEEMAFEPRRGMRVPISQLRGKTNPLPNATPDQVVDLGHPNAYPFMEWAADKMEERAERETNSTPELRQTFYQGYKEDDKWVSDKKDPQDPGFVVWPGKKAGHYGDWDRSQMFRKAKHKRRAASRNARSARRRARR